MEALKKQLETYGKVETCEQGFNEVEIKLSVGFSIRFTNTVELIKEINEYVPEYNIIKYVSSGNDRFHLILKKDYGLRKIAGHIFFLIADEVLYEVYQTLRGKRSVAILSVPGEPDSEKCPDTKVDAIIESLRIKKS